jgi:polyferredoxin
MAFAVILVALTLSFAAFLALLTFFNSSFSFSMLSFSLFLIELLPSRFDLGLLHGTFISMNVSEGVVLTHKLVWPCLCPLLAAAEEDYARR